MHKIQTIQSNFLSRSKKSKWEYENSPTTCDICQSYHSGCFRYWNLDYYTILCICSNCEPTPEKLMNFLLKNSNAFEEMSE